jgi:LUC7 N_terminus
MGENYLSGPGTRAPQLSITDAKVCRSYLVGTCPHDLFTNTKQDFGPCPKLHSESLKAEYDGASDDQKKRWGFEFDYMRDIGKYVDECNRRIDTAQRRLEKTPDEIRQTNALVCYIVRHFAASHLLTSLLVETNIRSNKDDRNWSGRDQNSV